MNNHGHLLKLLEKQYIRRIESESKLKQAINKLILSTEWKNLLSGVYCDRLQK